MFVYITLTVVTIALVIVSAMLYFACSYCNMQKDAIAELKARNQTLCAYLETAHELVVDGSANRAKYLDNVLFEISMYED